MNIPSLPINRNPNAIIHITPPLSPVKFNHAAIIHIKLILLKYNPIS